MRPYLYVHRLIKSGDSTACGRDQHGLIAVRFGDALAAFTERHNARACAVCWPGKSGEASP